MSLASFPLTSQLFMLLDGEHGLWLQEHEAQGTLHLGVCSWAEPDSHNEGPRRELGQDNREDDRDVAHLPGVFKRDRTKARCEEGWWDRISCSSC